ncbi:hypothetical protein HAX54_001282 [Datura stramonium]|uniref:Uncharacterized protein n=1 Tax=Datura stramonium TaxID=4076 RepID=A0ABS8WUJ5_DATST|nr:hypothetical protein [Datura stramonium]
MRVRKINFSTSLSFSRFVTRLCKEAYVLIFSRIDVETTTNKKRYLEKFKDEPMHDLRLHKLVPEVFGPSGQETRVAGDNIDIAGVDRHGKQMKLFAEQLGNLVYKAIAAALASYESLHALIDDMEA